MATNKYHRVIQNRGVVAPSAARKSLIDELCADELTNQSALVRLEAELVGVKLAAEVRSFETRVRSERYRGLNLPAHDAPKLQRFAAVWGERINDMRDAAEFAYDEQRGLHEGEGKGEVGMLAEAMRTVGEATREWREKEDGDVDVEGGNRMSEAVVHEGVAKLCLEAVADSRRLREARGFHDQHEAYKLADEKERAEVPVIVDHVAAHERLVRETRELREKVEASLTRARAVNAR